MAIGGRRFISGFQLAGVVGEEVHSSEEGLKKITALMSNKNIGLIVVNRDIMQPVRDQLIELRSTHPIPLIYEIPAPGSKQEKVGYREMLRKILGV